MTKTTQAALRRQKITRIITVCVIVAVALAVLVARNLTKVKRYDPVVAPTPNPTMLAVDYQKALKNMDEGDFIMALIRFEYILAFDKEFPGAAEKLAGIRALFNATPTAPGYRGIIPTMAPVQPSDPRQFMNVTATLVSTNTPAIP